MDQNDSKSKPLGDSVNPGSLLPSFCGRYGTTVIRRSLLFLRLNRELMTLPSSLRNAFWSSIGWLIFALWTMTNGGPEFRLMLPVVVLLKRHQLKVSASPVRLREAEPILSYSMTLRFPLTLLPTSCVKSYCSWLLKANPSLRRKPILVLCFSGRRKLLSRFIVRFEKETTDPLSGPQDTPKTLPDMRKS
jgi:hypothetical protein